MTNTGVVSDFFKDNYNCYMVEGYQRDDFFEKLKIAISSTPSASERLAHNAYNTAKEHFAYKNYTSLFTDFFNLSNRDTSPETGTKG